MRLLKVRKSEHTRDVNPIISLAEQFGRAFLFPTASKRAVQPVGLLSRRASGLGSLGPSF